MCLILTKVAESDRYLVQIHLYFRNVVRSLQHADSNEDIPLQKLERTRTCCNGVFIM